MLNGKYYTIYDVNHLPEEMKLDKLNCKTVGNILAFFTRYCALSNHYQCTFVGDGMEFSSVEQYLMFQKAKKFEDDRMADTIMTNDDPSEVKALGKKISNFNFLVWKEVRDTHMRKAVKAKFDQNLDLQAYLKGTGDKILVEANPNDVYWGAGRSIHNSDIWDETKWMGENMLGKVLSEYRDQLME